jgi:alpha-tubulin suppressor-like RCC1 family protein
VTTGACDGAGTCNGTASSCTGGDFCWLGACVKVSATTLGIRHTCALTTGGSVQCWGANDFGQLGNGSTTPSLVPVAVSGLSSGITAIAAGDVHTCALTAAGGVQCWGRNFSGQLGNDSTVDSPVPVAVSGLSSGVAAIASGESYTCALTTGGGVQCWGFNGAGALGNNSTTDSHAPVTVAGLGFGVAAITAGGGHTCALTTMWGVQCWGFGTYGQLGNGLYATSLAPVAISGPSSNVVAIAAGGLHTCALTTAGTVRCWGWNMYGQLGNGSTTGSAVPVAVSGLTSNVAAVTAGGAHTCALTTGGGLWCWGNNQRGQLGGGVSTQSPVPIAVSGLSSGVAAVVAGCDADDTCAVTAAGALLCWGWNNNGQLGNGSTTDSSVPVSVVEP